MPRSRAVVVVLIVFAALLQSACTPAECDPNSDQYDPDACETVIGNVIEYLTQLAYGNPPPGPPPASGTTCPSPLICRPPHCLFVHENGSFEVDQNDRPALWFGDETQTTITAACHDDQSLDFIATTPDGASPSTSAQIYQVIDLAAHVPEAERSAFQRVRAQAAFAIQSVEAHDDRQFGVRLDAYAGDPAAFPRTGDLETIPTQTAQYERLTTATDTFVYDAEGEVWQAEQIALALPETADFVVVVLEHEEDVQNDTDSAEFLDHGVDYVQLALDGGNTPPVAVPDFRSTAEDVSVSIAVLANDTDANSRLDRGSVTIIAPPSNGTVEVQMSGVVRYVPTADFNGIDTFTYRVADEEGLLSAETPVTIEVRPVNDPPAVVEDAYTLPEGGFLTVPVGLGVLANDTDADGDTLTAELVQDVGEGSLTLDPTGAFTYSVPADFSGTTHFTYRANDGEATSGATTVTLTREASGYDLALTKTVSPGSVGPSGEATFTVTVTNAGPAPASGVQVTDHVPDFELTVQSITANPGTFDQGSGLWTIGDLDPAETATLTITALIHLDATNTATITAGLDDDTDASNNSAAAVVTVNDNPPNNPPQVSDPIDDFAVRADPPEACAIDLSTHFSDPDGDALSYSFAQSNDGVNVSLSGSTITVSGWRFDQTSITVTAQDGGGLSASDTFVVTSGATTDCGGNSAAP